MSQGILEGVKHWWASLGQPTDAELQIGNRFACPDITGSPESRKKDLEKAAKEDGVDSSWYKLKEEHYKNALERENTELKCKLHNMRRIVHLALAERKLASKREITEQLTAVLNASEAVAHRKLSGSSPDSEMGKIISKTFDLEITKLYLLIFGDINITDEEAKVTIIKYLNEKGPFEGIELKYLWSQDNE